MISDADKTDLIYGKKTVDETVRRILSEERRRSNFESIDDGRSPVPIVGIGISWAVGIACGIFFDLDFQSNGVVVVSLVITMIIMSIIINQKGHGLTARMLILCATCLIGWFHAHNSCKTISQEHLEVASFGDLGIVQMKACVAGHPERPGPHNGLLGPPPMDRMLQTIPLVDVSLTDTSSGRSIKCSKINMKVPTGRNEVIAVIPGDECRARVRVFNPGGSTNPGCDLKFAVEPILMIEHPSLIDVTRTGGGSDDSNLISLHEAWSMVVSDSLDSSICWFGDESEHDLIRAIVLGDRTSAFESLSQPYKRTGTAHYLAVSGFAIGVFSAIPALVMRGRGSAMRGLTMMIFLGLGMSAIDLRAPAIRSGAVIMLATFGISMGREWSRIGLLSLISIIMLGINPRDIMNPGFQLTFVVVASLITLTPHMSRLIPTIPGDSMITRSMNARFTRDMVSCGVIAWLTSTPLVLHHFGIVCPIGIIASIVLMPLMTVMIISSVISIMTALVFPSLSWIPGACSVSSMKSIEWVIMAFDSIPGSFFVVSEWPLFVTIGVETVIWRSLIHRNLRERMILIAATASLLLVMFLPIRGHDMDSDIRLVTMDMGNGTCHLIMTEESSYLFDGGSIERGSSGKKIILPVLNHHGIRRLDGVFISHANMDHFSGLSEIIGRIPIGSFIIGQSFLETSERSPKSPAGLMMKLLRDWRVPCQVVHENMEIVSREMIFRVHHPPDETIHRKENDNSLVVSLVKNIQGKEVRCVLFTGDIEEISMKGLMKNIEDLKNPIVLEAPHHGSVRPSSESFINTIDPDIIVQSTGATRMRRDHLSRIVDAESGITRFDTASHGAITMEFNDSGHVEVTTESGGSLCR